MWVDETPAGSRSGLEESDKPGVTYRLIEGDVAHRPRLRELVEEVGSWENNLLRTCVCQFDLREKDFAVLATREGHDVRAEIR